MVSTPSFIQRLITPDLVIGSAMVIALGLFVLWGASQVMAIQSSESVHLTLPPVSEVLIGTPSPSVQALTGSPTAMETQDGTPPPQSSEATQDKPSTTGTPGGSGQEPVFRFTPPSSDSPIQLYVIGRQTAWMRITVDDKVAFQGRVKAGSAYNFAGNKKIELLTGSAAAMQVFYNQQDLGSLGLVGQVLTLIFTDTGQVKPTITATPSLTPTPKMTATRQVTPTLKVSPSPSLTPFNQ
jgi:cytoskeleton protein RodZ